MATGMEIAGLILAAVPVIVKLTNHYRTGLDTLSRWPKYLELLQDLQDDLDLEITKLRLTLEQLLCQIVSYQDLERLLNNPRDSLWNDERVQKDVRTRLSYSYDSFMISIARFYKTLSMLVDRLQSGLDGKTPDPSAKGLKRSLKRVRFCFSKDGDDSLKMSLQKCNADMKILVSESSNLTRFRKKRNSQARTLMGIRQQAKDLHAVLENGPWACDCTRPHDGLLHLESRIRSPDDSRGIQPSLPLRFRVTFKIPPRNGQQIEDWRDTYMVHRNEGPWRPAEVIQSSNVDARASTQPGVAAVSSVHDTLSPPRSLVRSAGANASRTQLTIFKRPKSRKVVTFRPLLSEASTGFKSCINDPLHEVRNLQLIVCLCSTIGEVAEGRGWLGCLQSQGKPERFDVMAVQRRAKLLVTKNIISLTEVVQGLPKASTSESESVDRLDAVSAKKLSVCLASSVLQLYDTGWLDDRWSASEVYFPREINSNKLAFHRPFIVQSFAAQRRLGTPSENVSRPGFSRARNPLLFDLGLMLIEICLRAPLQSFRLSEDCSPNGDCTPFTNYFTALRMVHKIDKEFGMIWGKAVNACIEPDSLGVYDPTDLSLENETLRQAFYEKVVQELQADLYRSLGNTSPIVDEQ